MNRPQYKDSIKQYIEFLNELNSDNLFRINKLGNQSLPKFKPNHLQIIEKLKLIYDNAEEISVGLLAEIVDFCSRYVAYISDLMSKTEVAFVNARQDIINEFENFFEQFRILWQKLAGIIKYENDSLDYNIKLKELESALSDSTALKNSLRQQVNEFNDRYSDINTNVELETQVNIFEKQAIKNLDNSKKWLVGIVISGLILVTTLFIFYCNFTISSNTVKSYADYNAICDNCGQHAFWFDIVKHLIFKILIILVIIYVLSFCVKNYNASMHNKTNNEHRHNSFSAALHFYNTTTTSDRKEEILHKVADAIFTYQKSGYYGKDSEPSNPSIIQNVIDKVAGK